MNNFYHVFEKFVDLFVWSQNQHVKNLLLVVPEDVSIRTGKNNQKGDDTDQRTFSDFPPLNVKANCSYPEAPHRLTVIGTETGSDTAFVEISEPLVDDLDEIRPVQKVDDDDQVPKWKDQTR